MTAAIKELNEVEEDMEPAQVNAILFGQKNLGETEFTTTHTLLPMVCEEARNPANPEMRYSAIKLFDTGSDNTYVTTELAQKLNLPVIDRRPVTVSAFGETVIRNTQMDIVEVQLCHKKNQPQFEH
ncbi:hypothetical protein AB6A40_007768 [Gnathostoma spinigerum]|uniref:DUF1758 domain-containing protein n=1 Tax=Gnathostoma spinigerum TaxID=75299 RepID=A0ABD6EM87_9BILA